MYELAFRKGRVTNILQKDKGITFFEVEIPDEGLFKGINYSRITGEVNTGDEVIINTTAVDLELGTGGYHFLIFNLKYLHTGKKLSRQPGHIMKLRYTPFQLRTHSLEEEGNLLIQEIKESQNLEGAPVVIIPLHSLLAPLVIVFKAIRPSARVVYVMTEGGSLALELSNIVRELKGKGYIDTTITVGHAFGGDLEAVNIFTALIAARKIAEGGLIVVGMGPGIVGTGTKYGHSGVENFFIHQAIKTLQGQTIIVPRLSLADKRPRHYGISHHSLTLLRDLITDPVELTFPVHDVILKQLDEYGIGERHRVRFYPEKDVVKMLKESGFTFKSMGRNLDDDPLFFTAGGLASFRVSELLKE